MSRPDGHDAGSLQPWCQVGGWAGRGGGLGGRWEVIGRQDVGTLQLHYCLRKILPLLLLLQE